MKLCVIIFFNTLLLAWSQKVEYKHPYESNFNNEKLLEEIENLESIRKSNIDTIPYYQRLVKYLFRKQRFRSDPHSEKYFIANIPLRVNKQQYDILVNSDIFGLNVNEIDSLVEEILKQSSNEDWQQSITTILYEYYRQEILDSITTFSSPILWIILSLLVIIVVNKIFHFSKIKFVTIVFVSFIMICGISYYMTFMECMHDLEVEQIMILSKKDERNPCTEYHEESKGSWKSFKTWFSGSRKNECKEFMKKTLSPSKKYCNPLEVFFKWLAKLQMSYFGSIFEEFTDFFAETTSSMDFFSRIGSKFIYLLFFGISTIFIIVMFLKYVVQNIPNFLSHATSSSGSNQTYIPSIDTLSAKMDAMLKENVEIKREISILRERSEEPQPLPPPKKKHKLSAIRESTTSSKNDDSTDSN